MTLTLYHAAPSRSSAIVWLLEELGEPHTLELVDIREGRHRQTDFIKLNPLGKVPTLVHDGVVVTETAAVATYLADAFPTAKLSPPIGHTDRGAYLRWMFFYGSSWEPAVIDNVMKRDPAPTAMSAYGSYDTVIDTVAQRVASGSYLLGDRFSAADVVLGSGLGWTMEFGLVPKRPEFVAYMARLDVRPARKRAQEIDAAFKAKLG
jgi:glutathione S-transferase